MQSQLNPQDDPVISILISAYRRGREIQRRQAEKNQPLDSKALKHESPKEGTDKQIKHPPAG